MDEMTPPHLVTRIIYPDDIPNWWTIGVFPPEEIPSIYEICTKERKEEGGMNYSVPVVVTLKDDLLIASGTGTQDDPYILKTQEVTSWEYTASTSEPTNIIGNAENNPSITLTGAGATGCTSKIEQTNPDAEGYATEYKVTVNAGTGQGEVTLTLGPQLFRDKAGNPNQDSKSKGGLIIGTPDTTDPVITVSPTSTAKTVGNMNAMISVSDPGFSDGLASTNSYKWYLSPSDTNPTASGYVSGNYTSGKNFIIGTGLEGTYYLYIQQVFDKAGNGNTTNVTAAGVNYYKVGPYSFTSVEGTELIYKPSIVSYISPASENGVEDTEFLPSSYSDGWVILNNDGGNIEIISKEVVGHLKMGNKIRI